MDDAETIGAGTVNTQFLTFIQFKRYNQVSDLVTKVNINLDQILMKNITRCLPSSHMKTTWLTQAGLATAMLDSSSHTGSSLAKLDRIMFANVCIHANIKLSNFKNTLKMVSFVKSV